jgi:hypothetical protein
MPLPRRQTWFLGGMAALGMLLLLSGLWEFRLSGAVHELACGGTILVLAFAARLTWPRSTA